MRTLSTILAAILMCSLGHISHADEKLVKSVKIISAGDSENLVDNQKPQINSTAVYPDGALMDSYQEELFEIKKTEAAERHAIKVRDDYEKKKAEAEKEIAARKYKVEGYKMKQEQAMSDVDAMKTELQDLNQQNNETESELTSVEQKAQEHFVSADNVKKELETTKRKLEASLEKLKTLKEVTAKNINKNNIDVQKMRAEIAVLDAEVESVESRTASLESEEMKSRSEWMVLRSQIDEKNSDMKKNFMALADAKKKLELAQKDFRTAKAESELAEKNRLNTEIKTTADIRKLDESQTSAQRARAMAEADRIRAEAETEKLKAYVAMVKKSNDDAVKSMKESQSAVMESRLALETAKSELTREVAGGEKQKFKDDKLSARIRGLASVAEASDMMDGGKSWSIVKSCKIMKRPSEKSDVLGEVSSGQNLVGSKHAGNWVKILNTSGEPAFVKSECGKFQ